jgi:predicted metal-dependent phosphoesterase TrpH
MRVDLHVHTYPASRCSSIAYRDFIAHCRTQRVAAIALTNHGDVADNRRLEGPLAEVGTVLVHGVEISTPSGDFIVYSPDLDYLAEFGAEQEVPQAGTIAANAAVVWVHPAAGGGRSGSLYRASLGDELAPLIDAIEVWNGNWTQRRFVGTAARLCRRLGLPATAGSDAHRVQRLGVRATEIGGEVRSTADVVAAIKAGTIGPAKPGAARGAGRLFESLRRSPTKGL